MERRGHHSQHQNGPPQYSGVYLATQDVLVFVLIVGLYGVYALVYDQ